MSYPKSLLKNVAGNWTERVVNDLETEKRLVAEGWAPIIPESIAKVVLPKPEAVKPEVKVEKK